MHIIRPTLKALAAAVALISLGSAHAAIVITEVAPWASGNSPYAKDWFELTNTGSSAVNISGWKFDDSSNSFASAAALTGITSIAAGESVIFTEGSAAASFLSTWFGAAGKPGLQVGYYSGSGLGLSTDGDAVNIFNAAGVKQTGVSFGVSDSSSPYQTFDNAAGLATVTQLSVVGTNGAFVAINDVAEIGSPGSIAAVPEASTYAMLLAGLGMIGVMSRRRTA
ncbi:MAG: lamin tail domain-containing protein [Rhodocyclaceae bacterium]